MKKYKYIIALGLFSLLGSSSLMAAELVVSVENIKKIEGSLYLSLYKSQDDFDTNNNAVKRQKVTVDTSTQKINLGDVQPGDYAVKVFHDINDNGKFDFGSSGMPAEPYGSSSQSKELAPPSFKDAKFALDKNQQVQVYLITLP